MNRPHRPEPAPGPAACGTPGARYGRAGLELLRVLSVPSLRPLVPERPPARRARGAQARPSSPLHSKGPAARPRLLSPPPGNPAGPAAPGPPPARTAAPQSERHRRALSAAIDPAPLRRPPHPFRPLRPTERELPWLAPPPQQPIPAALTAGRAARGAGGGWLHGGRHGVPAPPLGEAPRWGRGRGRGGSPGRRRGARPRAGRGPGRGGAAP